MNNVTKNTFLLVSSSVWSKQLLCFVHGHGQKREQNHTTKKFVGFHNHSPLLTMAENMGETIVLVWKMFTSSFLSSLKKLVCLSSFSGTTPPLVLCWFIPHVRAKWRVKCKPSLPSVFYKIHRQTARCSLVFDVFLLRLYLRLFAPKTLKQFQESLSIGGCILD